MECVFPHAFIHYENKLRTKQFFELYINMIPDIGKELPALAISQYNDIISFATEIATIAHFILYTKGSSKYSIFAALSINPCLSNHNFACRFDAELIGQRSELAIGFL